MMAAALGMLLSLLLAACGAATEVSDTLTPAITAAQTAPATAPATAGDPPPTTPSMQDASPSPGPVLTAAPEPVVVKTGADVLVADGFAALHGLHVGLIANQTSVSGGDFLLDLLHRAPEVELAVVFAPEHGVRGTAGAGDDVGDTVDPTTGVPIISLYKPGSDFRPSPAELSGIDVLVYDLQDVGARFYTYISTMGRSMEAAAHAGIPFVVLDRPNPSGGVAISGFTRTPDQVSFVSEYPIPALYGLTSGELAQMIVAEGWKDVDGLDLRVIAMQGWDRGQRWDDTGLPWIPPSPGLPAAQAALVYPGTVLVEATTLSFGRGTLAPFTQVGAPWVDAEAVAADLAGRGLAGVRFQATSFVPEVIPDVAENPAVIPFLGQTVPAVAVLVTDATAFDSVAVGIHLLEAFQTHATAAGRGELIDRAAAFDLLAGTAVLRQMLQSGVPAAEIVRSWTADVETFETQRQPYLIY
ncbi:MAG TPA: DUF1343 domain-containing protein [Euzebya sp.]|nr:DUF1343 domain-containing protein [Euzebya sp.]